MEWDDTAFFNPRQIHSGVIGFTILFPIGTEPLST